MGLTNFPHGISSYGAPVLPSVNDVIAGDVYFVGATAGLSWVAGSNSTGNGQKETPFATIDYAIGKCTANNGDVIYVLPGHTENLTTATSINCDVAGVSIIGLGNGTLIPTLSTTAAAGSITIGTTNITLQHLRLTANYATGTTTMITVAAAGDGAIIRGIQFRDTSATSEALIHIQVATTVTDMVIENCNLVTAAGSMTSSIYFVGTSTDCIIRNNYFFTDCSASVIDHLTGASVNLQVFENKVINVDTGAGLGVSIKSDGTGYVARNHIFGNKTDATPLAGAAMVLEYNFVNNTLASSGILFPSGVGAIP